MRLAREAHQAQDSGQLVRAYLLYAEAAARDPHTPGYAANRDALRSIANLLTKANVQAANVDSDVKEAEHLPNSEPPIELATPAQWQRDPDLQPIPRVRFSPELHDFDLRSDEKKLLEEVPAKYGVRAIWDPELEPQSNIRFEIGQADFRTALDALTAATHTFVFPISQNAIFFARDSEAKRSDYEPNVLLTFNLPDAIDQKDIVEAASAVRGALNLHTIGWDSESRTVMIRDRYTRAHAARSLLEAVLLPKAQVSIEVEFITFDSDHNYHYGVALPTSFQLINFGHVGGFRSILETAVNSASFLGFGGGASLFGIGLTNAQLFATVSDSTSRQLYDATVVVDDGQSASLHVGDKYPIPQSLNTGAQANPNSIYNPIGEVTLEDLGLLLKMTPRVNGDGDISIDVEAEVKALGTQTFNTVPSISERQFKGSVSLREGEWAVVAGMDLDTSNITRNGLLGLSQISGLNQVLSENTRDRQTSSTLLILKPRITRLPMSADISPQFFLGPVRGERVLL